MFLSVQKKRAISPRLYFSILNLAYKQPSELKSLAFAFKKPLKEGQFGQFFDSLFRMNFLEALQTLKAFLSDRDKLNFSHMFVRLAGKYGGIDVAEKEFEEVKDRGIVSEKDYQAMLSVFMSCDQLEKMYNLIGEMSVCNYDYSTLILGPSARLMEIEKKFNQKVVEYMKESYIGKSCTLYEPLKRHLIQDHLIDPALNVSSLDSRDTTKYLSTLHNLGYYQVVYDEYEKLKFQKTQISPPCLAIVFRSLTKFASIAECLLFFNQISEKSVEIYNILLAKLMKIKNTEKVLYHFDMMKQDKVSPNFITYTIVLSAVVSEEYITEFWDIMIYMKQAGYYPLIRTYNKILAFYLNSNRIDEFMETITKIETDKIEKDYYTLTMILTAMQCQKSPEIVQVAKDYLQQVCQVDFSHSEQQDYVLKAYSSEFDIFVAKVIQIFMENGEMQLCKNVLLQVGNENSFKILLQSFLMQDNTPGLLSLLDDETFIKDIYVYNHVIHHVCKKKDEILLKKLLEKMEIENIKPDVFTWSSIAYFYSKNNPEQLNLKTWTDPFIIRSLLMGLAQSNLFSKVIKLYETLRNSIRLDNDSLNVVLLAVCKSSSSDSLISDFITHSGIELDSRSYNTLIDLYLERKDLVSVENVLKDMQKRQISPNEITWILMLKYEASKSNFTSVRALFEKIKVFYPKPCDLIYEIYVAVMIDNFHNLEQSELANIMNEISCKEIKLSEQLLLALEEKMSSFAD